MGADATSPLRDAEDLDRFFAKFMPQTGIIPDHRTTESFL
jgi:hypothetical protein